MPGGKFTDHVFGAMKEKEILRVEGPFGSFFRARTATNRSCCSPGTGFPHPSRPSSSTWSSRGITRPTVLYWGCRPKADLYLHDWAEAAAARLPNLRYVPVLSRAEAGGRLDGRTGLVHQAVMADLPDLPAIRVCASRRAHHGRVGEEGFSRSLRPARGRATQTALPRRRTA